MTRRRHLRAIAPILVLLLSVGATACTKKSDESNTTTPAAGGGETTVPTDDCPDNATDGIEGDTITLASTYPQTGILSAFVPISYGYNAYFDKMNKAGGVEVAGKKYKIEVVNANDNYNAQETSTQIEKLMGTDGSKAFAAFSVVGTANNIAIRDQLGEQCIPDLFAATGSPSWGDPAYPWLVGSSLPPYSLESQAFAQYLKTEKPDATVAMLLQNDDFGRAYEESFKQAIEGTDITVAKVERYQAGVSTDVSPQVTSLAASKADAFFNGATLVPCPSALNKASELNWKPILYVSGTCITRTLMGVAGQAGDKALSATNIMDPQNPDWDSNANMKDYVETLTAYAKAESLDNPDELYLNGAAAYGWTQAAIMEKALEASKEMSRPEVVASLRNLDLTEIGLVYPDLSIKTGPGDAFMGETLKLVQYDFAGTHFKPLEAEVDFEGKTGDLTPEDLISG